MMKRLTALLTLLCALLLCTVSASASSCTIGGVVNNGSNPAAPQPAATAHAARPNPQTGIWE